jgi:flagellar protein FlaG
MKVDTGAQTAVAALSSRPPEPASAPTPGQGSANGQAHAPIVAQAQGEFISAARALREALGPMFHTEPRFRVDPSTNRVQVEIVDQNTGDVIREIPSDTLVRFAHTFDILLGLNVDETV